MIEIDLRSRMPIYEQLVDGIKNLIITKKLMPDEQLPSVRTLAKEMTINPNTIQKAYRELERQGYIYTVKGRGNFVNSNVEVINVMKIKQIKQQLTKLIAEAIYLGMKKEDILNIIKDIESVGKGER